MKDIKIMKWWLKARIFAGIFAIGIIALQCPAAHAQKTGVVKVDTNPVGAYVYAQGKAWGPTPVFVELQAGSHTLVITRDGYAPVTRKVSVRTDRVERLDVKLALHPGESIRVHQTDAGGADDGPGTVAVVTHPPGLTIFMNDLLVPQTTPVVFDIRSGIYELRLEHGGQRVYRKTVFVRAGRMMELDLTVKRSRRIDDSDPWE